MKGLPMPSSPSSVLADYPDRRFQVWDYRVGHGSLLIRSPQGPDIGDNVDLIFVGVEYLAVPHHMPGLVVKEGTATDLPPLTRPLRQQTLVYRLISAGNTYLVAAVACRIDINRHDIFASPFELPRWTSQTE